MPRKRMIDPEFWRDEKIGQCTPYERLLFIGLWNFADDNGVGRANPKLIKADIFLYDTLRDSDVEKSLLKLSELGLIDLYTAENQDYYYVKNFKKYQVINKPTKSNKPLPEHYRSTTVVLPNDYRLIEENIKEEKESNKKEIKKESNNSLSVKEWEIIPPTIDMVKKYCLNRNNSVDPQRFFDFYQSKGWIVGKNMMKDWQACVRTWEQREKDTKGKGVSTDAWEVAL